MLHSKQAYNGPSPLLWLIFWPGPFLVSMLLSPLLKLIVDLYLFWPNPSSLGWSHECFWASPCEYFWASPHFHGLIILSLQKNTFLLCNPHYFFLGPIFLNYKIISHDFIFRSTFETILFENKQTHIRTCILNI